MLHLSIYSINVWTGCLGNLYSLDVVLLQYWMFWDIPSLSYIVGLKPEIILVVLKSMKDELNLI